MTGAAWAVVVLAMAVLVIAGAAAIALNPGAFFYELGKLAWADLWPKLLPQIIKAFHSSKATRDRVRDDTRRRVDRTADGRERMR